MKTTKTSQPASLQYIIALAPLIVGIGLQNGFITLIGAILLIRALLPNKPTLATKVLPQSFLALNRTQRKQSLDYAWNNTKRAIDSIPGKTISAGIMVTLASIMAVITGIVMLFAIREDFGIFFFFLIVSSLFSYVALSKKIKSKYAQEEDMHYAKVNKHLARLAQRFISTHVKDWVNDIKDKQIDKGVLEIAHTEPDKIYTLYSEDIALFSENKMPAKVLHLTYILVGKYMTVIDKISIDIRKISYLYLQDDSPVLPEQDINLFNSEEFHYKDMIEIGYKGAQNNSISGHLFISLVNATQKEYPTSKCYVENLFTDVRTRVREVKLG